MARLLGNGKSGPFPSGSTGLWAPAWRPDPAFLQPASESSAEALEPAGRWAAVAAYTAGTASLAAGIAGAGVLLLVTGHLTG